MNNPSPLIPQGSLQEQKNRSRTRMRAAFVFIASIHIIGLVTLLTMQGCKREQPPEVSMDTPPETPLFEPTNPPVPIDDTQVGFTPPTLQSNEVTRVPFEPPVAAPTEYTIVKGDSFSSIAKAHGTSAKAIQEANPGVDPLKLQIGQKIVLPSPSPSSPAQTDMPPPSGEVIYSVVSGDTLTSIAKKYSITVNQLRSANNLTTDRIKVGQKLKIPAKPPGAMITPTSTPGFASSPTPNTTLVVH